MALTVVLIFMFFYLSVAMAEQNLSGSHGRPATGFGSYFSSTYYWNSYSEPAGFWKAMSASPEQRKRYESHHVQYLSEQWWSGSDNGYTCPGSCDQ
jgi:hypothetical protein